jgi:predicted nuclease of predicted toxin-antitoxin system
MLIRYYLDEHIFAAVASALRQRGIDTLTTAEAGNLANSDEQQLAFAAAESRVLVTRDKDYLIMHSQGVPHAGIVRWHSKHQSYRELFFKLIALWRTHTAEEMVGRVEYY